MAHHMACWRSTVALMGNSVRTTSPSSRALQTFSEWRSSSNSINARLQAALDRHQVLLREVNHRVKNSLQVVSSMLHLQANAVGDQDLSERLNEAASRVNAVGRAYDRLAYTADYENIDLIEYLRQIINDLQPTVAPCRIQFDAPPEAIQFAADRAILI